MNQRGAVLLVTVMIAGAIAALATVALLLSGIDSTIIGNEYASSTKAKTLADGCVEDALLTIKNDNAFTGTVNLTINGDDCDYEVINTGGANRTIQSQATIQNDTRRVRVTLTQLSPQLVVNTWEEVANF